MEVQSQNFNQQVENRPYLVIGAGVMGKNYLKKLLAAGVSTDEISVVDTKEDKLSELAAIDDFQGLALGTELPEGSMEYTFVLSNSPAHLQNLRDIESRSDAVLIEKPAVTVNQLEYEQEIVALAKSFNNNAYVAYIIEFSSAVEKLAAYMKEHNLRVLSGKGIWQKNRKWEAAKVLDDGTELREKNGRPTAGDLEDEMTHQLAALLFLSNINQTHGKVGVNAALGFDDFVKPGVQEELRKVDSSVPLQPNSTTDLKLSLKSNFGNSVELDMWSSFVAQTQQREISVVLGGADGQPSHRAKLVFDTKVGSDTKPSDTLVIEEIASKETVVDENFQDDKLQKLVDSFLKAAKIGASHPGLKSLMDALNIVKIADFAERSHKSGETEFFALNA